METTNFCLPNHTNVYNVSRVQGIIYICILKDMPLKLGHLPNLRSSLCYMPYANISGYRDKGILLKISDFVL